MLPLLGLDKVSSGRTAILLLYATKKTTLSISESGKVPQVVTPVYPQKLLRRNL